MLKFSGDAANLANARHRLSRLFCSFLRRLSNTPVDDVPDALQERLVSRLGIIFEDEDISEGTVRAARRAVRRMCTDRQALIHMRARWNTISVTLVRVPATPPSTAAPSSKAASKGKSPHRPIKHYQNHVQKLVQVGGSDVKDASKRLLKYIDHHDAINVADPGISTKLCRSIEKVVFHVVLCHKKEGKFVIQSHAARALAASVGRKFERAGFSKRFVSRASSLTRAMVDDPDAVALTYSWAKKRADREASADEVDSGNIRGLAKEDNDELLGGRRDVDDDSTTSSSSGSSSSTSTSSADDDIIGGSRRSRSASRGSHASRRSRSASRSVSRNSRSRSGSRVGSRGRSRSAGKGAQDAGSLRSRSRSRSRSQTGSRRSGRSESRESRASMGRLEEDAEAEIDRRLAEMAAAEEEEEEEESESHSDDEGKIYRYGKVGAAEGSALSDDTDQSQWARVQMEKEKERLRMMYMQDRDLSGDRDGRTQVDVSRRLRSAKDSVARHSARDAPSPSDDEESVVSDEPVRRVGTMRSGHSPQRRRKSKSPFRSDLLQFREVAPQERLVS